jgi:hypothetical protein
MLYGRTYLPQIMPHDAALYTVLRNANIWVADLFFATILTHVAAGAVSCHGAP